MYVQIGNLSQDGRPDSRERHTVTIVVEYELALS